MRTLINALGLFVAICCISCEKDNLDIEPSPQVTERDVSVSSFEELIVSDALQVFVRFSGTSSLKIEANDNLHSLFEIEENNGKLSVGLRDRTHIKGNPVLNVYINANTLYSLAALGATNILLETSWMSGNAEINLSGACSMAGTIESDKLNIELTGASTLEINGSSKEVDVHATGASHLGSYSFSTDRLEADLGGASDLSLTVNETLDVKASGASTVYYKGDGIVESQDLSGGSAIVKE